MSRPRPAAYAALLTAATIGADQLAKVGARAAVDRGDRDPILPLVDLVNTRNKGVAFGFLGGSAGWLAPAVAAVALLALLVWFALQRDRPLAWLPTGLLLGGALGNVIDRVRDGAVTDFIDLPAWPPFNLADMAITFGVLALLYVLEGPPARADVADRA